MRADARANHAAVVTAARRLIAVRGPDVPMSAVAEEAGVGIATVYRRFPTREDLLLAVIEDVRDLALQTIEQHLPQLRTAPEEGWTAMIRALARLRAGTVMPGVVEQLNQRGAGDRVEMVRSGVIEALTEVIDVARGHGLVADDLTPTRLLLGLGTITRPLPVSGLPELDGLQDWLLEVYIRGLRP